MLENTEEKILAVLDILYPKIKSVLQQTNSNERDDLQQILVESIIKKISSGHFEDGESLMDLLKKEYHD
ncbi:hypothetical protein [Chengkuizengella sediminis]|uniref:hypothetical protein n=1 Tax=Chengkuizengella sediminis TaxID=1885917 RepID=UPI00138A4F9F|nr:hypothetical protein [Chengkuizengella sediminis]NDI35181.1 hypothetical protein [Chengkuizengella sediminis]